MVLVGRAAAAELVGVEVEVEEVVLEEVEVEVPMVCLREGVGWRVSVPS